MRQDYPDPILTTVLGFSVMIDDTLGHLAIRHDGAITWSQLQAIKNYVWGDEVAAIEAYPPQSRVIDNVPMRHLWRLGADDFCPDLLGRAKPRQTLENRFMEVWKDG